MLNTPEINIPKTCLNMAAVEASRIGHDDNDDDDENGSPVYSHASYSHIYGIIQYGKTHRQIPI